MRSIFFDTSGLLRSGWRALLFLALYGVVSITLIVTALFIITQLPISEATAAPLRMAVPFLIATAAALLVGWMCSKLLEELPYRSLGAAFTKGWLAHLGLGSLLGGVTFLIALVITLVGGGIQISANRISASSDIAFTLTSTFIIFVVAAASEETLFRGYLLQTFLRSGHLGFAVALTAFLFAWAHGGNPSVSGLSWFNTLLAGAWFGVAYLKTRDLWFPAAMHLVWNWLQGPVFGIEVSGIKEFASDPLLRAADNGPAWLTGGNYGIEGGIACTFALAISMIAIWFLPVRRDEELLDLTSPRRPGS